MKFLYTIALVSCAAYAAFAAGEPRLPADPYGTCLHITRLPKDTADASKLYPMMREAGITRVRSDLDWWNMEPEDGKFSPEYDQILKGTVKGGVEFLPIIQFCAWPGFARPFESGMDRYGQFLRHCLKNYGKDIRYWEVVNEPNWHCDANPTEKQYSMMLERTYREVKAFDPSIQVLYAGLAGCRPEWVEKTFELGAHKNFDVFNVHPYCEIPEQIPNNLKPLQALMRKYGVGDKPLWITEIGWASVPTSPIFTDLLRAALRRLGINQAQTSVAIVCDYENGYGYGSVDSENLPGFKSIRCITMKDLATISPKKYPVLIPVGHERVPEYHVKDLLRYVRQGGTLVFPSGLPLYFAVRPDGKGGLTETQVNDKYMNDFHIAWDSWWTKPGIVPQQETYQRPTKEFKGQFDWNQNDHVPLGRFLSDRNLKPGDRFIPMLEGGDDKFNGPLAGIYQFNSDLKGNIIAMTLYSTIGLSESVQSQFLPRAFLCGFNSGAERIFWYCFRNNHAQKYYKEAHFGLLDAENRPKPAYYAMKTLSTMLPGKSTVPTLVGKNNVYKASWTRHDGVKVWALWSAYEKSQGVPVPLKIEGKVSEALNHLGEKRPVPRSGEKVVLTGSILYLVGPENVEIME